MDWALLGSLVRPALGAVEVGVVGRRHFARHYSRQAAIPSLPSEAMPVQKGGS